ncbi:MAG: hypothetical protein GY851_20340 [bacterium]|nr:hypothetical protein [bacterium]
MGGQHAAGTPHVRVTPPATKSTEASTKAEDAKDALVHGTLVDASKTQADKKITVVLDGASRTPPNVATPAATTPGRKIQDGYHKVLGDAFGRAGTDQAAKQDSPTAPANDVTQTINGRSRGQHSTNGVISPTTNATARVQRLLITLNYSDVTKAKAAIMSKAANVKASADPTDRAPSSQRERTDANSRQQQTPKQR